MKKLLIVLTVLMISSCALLNKLRGNHGVPDMLIIPPDTIEVETPTTVEDVRG